MTCEKIYEQIEGIGVWFSLEDVKELSKLKIPKKPTILELGTGSGRSTKALRLLFPDADITTCDPAREISVDLIEDLKVTFIGEAGYLLDWDKPIDLLFVDDDHMTGTVERDIVKYKPFIKKNGYMVFHDYYSTGVEEAINNLLPDSKKVRTGEFSMAIWKNG